MKVTSSTLRNHVGVAERMARAYEQCGRKDAAEHFRNEAKRIAKQADEMAATEHPEFPHGEYPSAAEVRTMSEPPSVWPDDPEPDYNPN